VGFELLGQGKLAATEAAGELVFHRNVLADPRRDFRILFREYCRQSRGSLAFFP
jgi:hypothetical protein